jgi:F0F1-type ATP synthase assembly protein I
MSANSQSTKKKPYGAAILMGLVSAVLYIVLLHNQDVVNKYFSLGGLYAFLPILTAFVFSFIHGSFTGNFWTILGVEASKKKKEVK